MRPITRLCLACATLIAAGCADRSTVEPIPPTSLAPLSNARSESSTDLWRSIITGETGPGSRYAIYVPHNWKGDVIFYAHGIRDVLDPVGLQDQNTYYAVRDQLGTLGYAVAYSSFSENGYDLADAVRRTHQLRGLFASRFGQPAHSYLVGHSLGALAIMQLAERYPKQYDGAVAVCGIVGGTQLQLDYVVNVRALFDYFYPGVIPGSAAEPAPGYDLRTDLATQGKINAALKADPTGLYVIANTAQTPLEARNDGEGIRSLLTALFYHARGADNVLTFTHGKFPVSNVGVTYSPRSSAVPAGILAKIAEVNANIERFDADRAGVVWAEKNFTPSGNLAIPTMTLHNFWDPLVPHFHEDALAARVASAGATNLLWQRADDLMWGYGHCEIPASDQVNAITGLARWVTTGVKPAH